MAGLLSDRVARLSDPARQEAMLRMIGEAWATAANDLAPDGAPRPDAGGGYQKLKGGITFEVESPTRGYLVLPKQARYVLYGTRPHIIQPKAGRMGRNGRSATLRFSSGSTTYYRRVVHHPGTSANPFYRAAFASAGVQAAIAQVKSMLAAPQKDGR